MIQRIQTLYLLFAAIAILITMAMPVAYKESAAGSTIPLYISESIPAMGLAFASALLSLIAVFLFKNRILQMRISLGAMALALFTLAALCFFDFVSNTTEISEIGYLALLMPIFAFVFNWLAYRGIKADEQLVRSMDRLR